MLRLRLLMKGNVMGRIHGQGREDRKDRVLEVGVQPLLLFLVQPGVIHQVHAHLSQLMFEVVAVVRLLLGEQRIEAFTHAGQLLGWREAVVAEVLHPGFHL